MSGTRGGTGKPLYLKCSQCKKQRDARDNARSGKLMRTGRERPYKPRGATGRTSTTSFECKCAHCGHIGWYAHHDAERLPPTPEAARDFEPGFLEALDSLRRLQRCAARHNDLNGPMRLWSGEAMILSDAALSLLDRFDAKRAKAQLLQNFRYKHKSQE